jgi:anti-sigma factor RsiW
MGCRETKNTRSRLVDLLLDPELVPVEVRRHIDGCSECRKELQELQSTMELMDEWVAPEVNQYFDARVLAQVRAEHEAGRASFFERLKARFMYGSNLRMQPLMAGALALVVLVGGGTYADLSWQASRPHESAAVRDLQSLDGNAEVFQQLDSIDQPADQQGQDSGVPADSPTND